MKLLNLAALTKSTVKRVVQVGDKEHEIITINVKQFLEILEESKDIVVRAENGDMTMADEVRLTMKVVSFALPTITAEELETLNLDQLQAIAAFAKGEDVEGVEDEAKDGTDEDSAETEGK